MSIHVFCSRVYYYISAVFKWLAENRGGKSAVYYERYAVLVRDVCKSFNVQYAERRVSNGLAENELGVRLKSAVYFFVACVRVYKYALNSELFKCEGK